jgi:hypothetical protein
MDNKRKKNGNRSAADQPPRQPNQQQRGHRDRDHGSQRPGGITQRQADVDPKAKAAMVKFYKEVARKGECISPGRPMTQILGVCGLIKEFEKLGAESGRAEAFKKHPSLNRYTNVPCYDATRVKLAYKSEPQDSDYIHANWIKSKFAKLENKFICTQVSLLLLMLF